MREGLVAGRGADVVGKQLRVLDGVSAGAEWLARRREQKVQRLARAGLSGGEVKAGTTYSQSCPY